MIKKSSQIKLNKNDEEQNDTKERKQKKFYCFHFQRNLLCLFYNFHLISIEHKKILLFFFPAFLYFFLISSNFFYDGIVVIFFLIVMPSI